MHHNRLNIALATSVALLFGSYATDTLAAPAQRYVVQAGSTASASQLVRKAGGTVVADLAVINAVGAALTAPQARALRSAGVTLYPDTALKVANGSAPGKRINRDRVDYHHPLLVSAPAAHDAGMTGKGVAVAVLDTGFWWDDVKKAPMPTRFRFDATASPMASDRNGHGTHVATIIGSRQQATNGIAEGIAPDADVGSVRAFDYDGSGSYIDVIRGIDWVVSNRRTHNIRVLNLSFSATPQSYYWDDPLNQAVMKAWQAGIVVVAAAGNDGPNPMTIGVPGNVPYIITVGAMSDNDTPALAGDDPLASFSSAGPTFEGFVKPEVVAPGGHVAGSVPFDAWIPQQHPDSMLATERQFKMSGTSQATAIVSGIVALMLARDPALTPDTVKCRLMASARRSVDAAGRPAYSVFQQGAGLVNALAAVRSTAAGCANQGLNIARDLAGQEHYEGPANVDANGNFLLEDAAGTRLADAGFTWNGAYAWDGGYLWSDGRLWSRTDLWSSGRLWSRGKLWSRSVTWVDGQLGTTGTTAIRSIGRWVEHE
jgi:serine protease AprX